MSIDRNNYEMYFLLYVDNELPAEERNAVEKFVLENADLKTELESLLSATLPSEEIIYASRNDLYKRETGPDLLHERLLLYVDNELEPSAVSSLEKEITSNSILKRELNILQQTKLDPEEKFVFVNKGLLYRHEKDRVISMRLLRVAIAAAIIGAGIFIGVSIYTKDNQQDNVAATDKKVKPGQKIIQPVKTTVPGKENNAQQQPEKNLASGRPKVTGIPVKENIIPEQQPAKNLVSNSPNYKNNSSIKKSINTAAENRNNANNQVAQKETNNLPKPYFENINNQKSNQIVSSAVQDNMKALQNKNEEVRPGDKEIAQSKIKEAQNPVEVNTLTETGNSYAKNAVMDETASEVNNDHILFIKEEKINRSKISGLFKKVKRVLTRNANINTGNSIKIAGIEIAAR